MFARRQRAFYCCLHRPIFFTPPPPVERLLCLQHQCPTPTPNPINPKPTNKVGTIESPDLARALFGIYLGPDPVSADAKAAFGRGLSALLSE
jgi:hypothetical protein